MAMPPDRLYSLDAMRGFAAIVVVFFHIDRPWGTSGYLAVDFFFLLSGFVLARTYEHRFATGLSFRRFAVARLIRLYPLYLAGLVLGFTAAWLGVARAVTNESQLNWSVLGLVLLPVPLSGSLFPVNPALWSLFYELMVNFLFALVLARMTTRRLVWLLLLSGFALLSVSTAFNGMDVGADRNTAAAGIVRTVFAFTLGVVLSRLHKTPAVSSWAAVAVMAGLVAALEYRHPGGSYDLVVAMLIAPALVWMGASISPPAILHKPCEALGDMSFALYAIHFPLFWIVSDFAERTHLPNAIWRPAFVLSVVALAWLAHRFFDVPLRAQLNAWVRQGRSYVYSRGWLQA